jgi:hypothetical protein
VNLRGGQFVDSRLPEMLHQVPAEFFVPLQRLRCAPAGSVFVRPMFEIICERRVGYDGGLGFPLFDFGRSRTLRILSALESSTRFTRLPEMTEVGICWRFWSASQSLRVANRKGLACLPPSVTLMRSSRG